MSYVTGSLLFVFGFAMIFFARPEGGKNSWVARFAFLGELYAVKAGRILGSLDLRFWASFMRLRQYRLSYWDFVSRH